MNANELRALQAPLKERYRSDADAARITLRARGALDDAHISCKVETGRALSLAGLHPATGGSGAELCSGAMLLEALALTPLGASLAQLAPVKFQQLPALASKIHPKLWDPALLDLLYVPTSVVLAVAGIALAALAAPRRDRRR